MICLGTLSFQARSRFTLHVVMLAQIKIFGSLLWLYVILMEHDVPLAETLKRRLKRLRGEELEACIADSVGWPLSMGMYDGRSTMCDGG